MYEKNMERNRLTNYFCFLTLVWRGFAWLGLLNWLAAAFQRKRERDFFRLHHYLDSRVFDGCYQTIHQKYHHCLPSKSDPAIRLKMNAAC